MPTMRNKAKNEIDISETNKRPSGRAGTKVKSATQRASTKVKQAGRAMKETGRRAKSRAKTSTRSRSV